MKTSYSSISTPVLKQNFHKMWMLVLLAFLAYFMACNFFILAGYGNLQDSDSDAALYLSELITHRNLYILVLDFFFPVFCAVFVFRYLHSPSAVTIIHTLPLTRKGLFFTNVLSGWIMAILPALLNGILLLCLSKPLKVFSDEYNVSSAYDSIPQVINIFSRSFLAGWLWQTLLLITLVYLIVVLAGMITGNSLMHFLVGVLLNVLPAGILLCIECYMKTFLYGYPDNAQLYWLMLNTSPLVGIVFHHSNLPLWLAAVYLLVGILLLFLSCFLYEKRKLEKTGQPLVFKWLDPVLCIIVTFLGMTGAAYLLDQLAVPVSSAGAPVYACLFLSSVFTFLIAKLLVKKSLHIFNLSTLKQFAVYCIVAILFVGSAIFDWIGFETRVPETADVKTAAFAFGSLHGDYNRFSSQYFGSGSSNDSSETVFSSGEAIRAVTDIHRDLIAHRLRNDFDLRAEFAETVTLGYGLKSDKALNRLYYIENLTDLKKRNAASLKQIYESEEFKSLFSWNNLKLDSTASLDISSPWYSSESSQIRLTGKDLREFLRCMEKDFQSSTYEAYSSTRMPCAVFSLEFNLTKFDPHSVSETNVIRTINDRPEILLDVIDGTVLHTDRHSVQWLKAHGYGNLLEPDLSKVKAMKISRYSKQVLEADAEEADYPSLFDESQLYDSQVTITDRQEMQRVIDACQPETEDANVYVCTFLMKKGVPESETLNEIHFTEDTVPGFLKEKLNQKKNQKGGE